MILFLTSLWVSIAAIAKGEQLLIVPVPSKVSWNQQLTVNPVTGHHFNLKSPNKCGQGVTESVSESQVVCRMTAPGSQELEVFVCDDAKFFCKENLFSWALSIQGPPRTGGST